MPKEPAKRQAKTARQAPTAATKDKAKKPKDPKASHLYTDDNPTTTLHGTGFKDEAAAHRTLSLIARRSLVYQFQTVNTMFHRAKHHPAMKKAADGAASTADMRKAMAVFREWLDVTYPAQRDALRAAGFKPLLSKKCVEAFLPAIEANEGVSGKAKAFARIYAALPKAKRLGNVLVDDTKPWEPDWEKTRYEALDALVRAGQEEEGEAGWEGRELWTEERGVTAQHLGLIAWAWSPVKESKLPSS
ncbi:hypothetical protein LTR53_010197 [Teratosphaeriaceae sp. CCFEE 6253]|nr:hypothetical protein LTR53_010197 [Teratosphaeriaceae sp. CCFEE 6253]